MKTFDLRFILAAATLAFLTACGGGADYSAAEQAVVAAPMAVSNAPVADCEAEGCKQPRVVDGLAEQFRVAAIAAPPAAPVQAGEPVQLGYPATAPSEAGTGAGVTLR
jgi:hypothetical protein